MIKNIISIAFLCLALCQWAIIGERTVHAFWMWRKFSGYGGGGYTTMNIQTIILGYISSILAILVALSVRRFLTGSKLSAKLLKAASIMIGSGLIWLSLLLVSPFSIVVR